MNYDRARNYIFEEIGDDGFALGVIIAENDIIKGEKFIMKLTSCDKDSALKIWAELRETFGTKETNPWVEIVENRKYETEITVECPYCHSTNTHKIPNWKKSLDKCVYEVQPREWHCDQCKSDF